MSAQYWATCDQRHGATKGTKRRSSSVYRRTPAQNKAETANNAATATLHGLASTAADWSTHKRLKAGSVILVLPPDSKTIQTYVLTCTPEEEAKRALVLCLQQAFHRKLYHGSAWSPKIAFDRQIYERLIKPLGVPCPAKGKSEMHRTVLSGTDTVIKTVLKPLLFDAFNALARLENLPDEFGCFRRWRGKFDDPNAPCTYLHVPSAGIAGDHHDYKNVVFEITRGTISNTGPFPWSAPSPWVLRVRVPVNNRG